VQHARRKRENKEQKIASKTAATQTQKLRFAWYLHFLENDLNRPKLNDTEMPKSKIKANKTKAQRH
jgi:hypothetical protein